MAIFEDYFLMAADPYVEVVRLACEAPRADFTWYTYGLHAWFEAYGDYGPTRERSYSTGVQWTLSDGGTGEGAYFHYTFPATGSYQVTLDVSNEWGADSITHTVEVAEPIPELLRRSNGRITP